MEDAKNWSVAVYLAGGDGLVSGMVRSLQDLRDETIERPGMAVAAQFEPPGHLPRRFRFGAGVSEPLSSYQSVVEPAPSSPMKRLEDFIRFSAEPDPEAHTMFVFSGHGNGAVGDFFGFRGATRALQVADLARILAAAREHRSKLDIIGMDCCNMSMVEVGFELAPFARYLVASESEVPSYGWPYRQWMRRVRGTSPAVAANEAVRAYADFYADYTLAGTSTHAAATSLDDLDSLTKPIARLADRLRSTVDDPDVWRPLVLAHWEAQSYKDEEYVDLADFCLRLFQHIPFDDVRDLCVDVMRAVGNVVRESRSVGSAFQYSTGLSVYFPWSHDLSKSTDEAGGRSILQQYEELAFSRATGWGRFLDAYLVATRRGDRAYRPRERSEAFSPAMELASRCAAS